MSRFRDDGSVADWLEFEEALDRILHGVQALPFEEVSLEEAPGRVTSQPLLAHRTLPPSANSAMDGFAVRATDVAGATEQAPIDLRIVGDSRPGAGWEGHLARGQAVRIMTGGPIPDGADSVIRVEHTDGGQEEGTVRIHSDADRLRHLRPAGEDMAAGDVALPAGRRIGAGEVAVLAGIGAPSVTVHRRPRVAILSTGDELLPVDSDTDPWDEGVPDTNTPTLAQAVLEAGGTPLPMGIARDSRDSLAEALDRVMRARPDLLLTTGGASMGAADLVKPALAEVGYEPVFWRVKIRPGSPVSYGTLPRGGPGPDSPGAVDPGPTHVFGLPGNPVSGFVTFQLLVRPFLMATAGRRDHFLPVVEAVASEPLTGARDLAVFLRVGLEPHGGRTGGGSEGRYGARLTGAQGSGLLNSLGRADGLAVLPRGIDRIEAGEGVDVVLLGGEGSGMPRTPLDP
jgi:molybdopterin molybdotransferase